MTLAGARERSDLGSATVGFGVAEGGSLDLHKGISDPSSEKCLRWPEHMGISKHSTGEIWPGVCKATNLCRYCQKLYVIETLEMLMLDALDYAPTHWIVLTAREHLTRAQTYRHLEQVRKGARRRWPDYADFIQVEFQRRGALHLNLLVKGVPATEVQELYGLVTDRWCARVDAIAAPFERMQDGGQWAGVMDDAGGVVRYLTKMLAHGLKKEQSPPLGWKGHRTSQTRNYFARPASVMREEARTNLRAKRELWKLETAYPDVAADVLDDVLRDRLDHLADETYSLVRTKPLSRSSDLTSTGERFPPLPGPIRKPPSWGPRVSGGGGGDRTRPITPTTAPQPLKTAPTAST